MNTPIPHLGLLADHPHHATQVARWYFDYWISKSNPDGFESVLANVGTKTSRLGPPMLLLALDGEELVGAADLKFHEMSLYPDYEHWLGGVYVDSAHRGRGIAGRLVAEALARAREAGIRRLYLQTQQVDGGLYTRAGFRPIDRLDYRGEDTLVMVSELK